MAAVKVADEHLSRRLDIIWRDEFGAIQNKTIPWRGASTHEALTEYIKNYLTKVNNGYIPEGFEAAPIPHCVRMRGKFTVITEWHLSPKRSTESPVTVDPPLGSGGIPTAVPSAPCSECLVVPTQPGPRSHEIQPELTAIRRTSPDSIRAVLTKG